MPDEQRYKAFLSYSHADVAWGRWLHRRLENYVVPKHIAGHKGIHGTVPRRLRPVFRDRDELPSDPDLNARVAEALRASEFLVVICSPASARSRWVNEEVRTFKRLGRADRVLCFIVAGEPGASDHTGHEDEECFCPALRHRLDDDGDITEERIEPIGADARHGGDGRRLARLKLIAGILGVGLDDLQRRDLQRRHRRLVAITIGSLVGMALTLTLAIAAYLAREDAERRRAQAEDLLGFMVGDLRRNLEPIGRLDLLDKVGDEAMAYFATVRSGDLSDAELSRQAQVLTQIGEVRMSQRRFDEALASFQEANVRSSALAERHPHDGDRVYDRSQAEFWVGYVHWRRGQLSEARAWLTRYRDSSRRLLDIDATRDDWIREVAYGHHNLAVLSLESGDLGAAADGFRSESTMLEEMLNRNPDDNALREALADAISWLGTVAEQRGELAAAAEYFHRSTAQRERMIASEPDNQQWRYWWARSLLFEAQVAAVSGHRDTARTLFDRALATMQTLVDGDPANLEWSRIVSRLHAGRGEVRASAGDLEGADEDASRARDRLEALVATESTDREARRTLAKVYRLSSWLQHRRGQQSAALASSRRATATARAVWELAPENDRLLGELASILMHEAQLQLLLGNGEVSRETVDRTIELLQGRVGGSSSPDLLDPWARALILNGKPEAARPALETLTRQGYQPIWPWPETG